MTKLGFKMLTLDNWLEPEKLPSSWVQMASNDGKIQQMSCEDWLKFVLEPKLIDQVPKQILALYEVARGALVYGCLFYPLYTIGMEQLFRVLETAVSHRCKEIGIPSNLKTYEEKINFLFEKK